MTRLVYVALAMALTLQFGWPQTAEAARYPDPQVNGFEFFYVFGSEGNAFYGAEEDTKVFVVQAPSNSGSAVTITVLDADTRGHHDELAKAAWNTSTRFTVLSGTQQLQSETVGPDSPDGTNLQLGPFSLSQGKREGEWTTFRIEVEGLQGDDNNLFAFDVLPTQAQFFAYNPAIRLAANPGDRMRLFPAVPGGTRHLIAWNYDLDVQGGRAALLAPRGEGKMPKAFRLKSSNSAEWTKTRIKVRDGHADTRWTFQITKGEQPRANMSLRLEDQDGQLLPIFLSAGERSRPIARKPLPSAAPVTACNTFDFDASKSFDADNEKLSFTWDFGDGATAEGTKIRHTFARAGEYKVLLTATDNSTAECRQSQAEQLVLVNMPPTARLDAPSLACAGSGIRVSASKSSDSANDRLRFSWDFGDGTTADGADVMHTFAHGGNYDIQLTVDDGRGTSCSRAVTSSRISVNSPPLARANERITMCSRDPNKPLSVKFDAGASKDNEGDALAYRWDFGDGATGEGHAITHDYQRGGQYTARLTVSDDSGTACSTSTASIPVRLNRAPVVIANRDLNACAAQSVTLDASGSLDPDGSKLSYTWDFGDGTTGKGEKVTHRYAKGGTYQVTLSADDGSGTECAMTSTRLNAGINSAPTAIVKAERIGCIGDGLRFDATDSSDPEKQRLSYRWDFGDGSTAEGAKVSHKYTAGGYYDVKLTVDDGSGTGCSIARTATEVRVNTPPVADAGANLVCCREDLNAFDASKSFDPDGDTLTYTWDFGDGHKASGSRVQHAYIKNGVFPVRLMVSDDSGSNCGVATAGFQADVNAAPVARMTVRGVDGVLPPTMGEGTARE